MQRIGLDRINLAAAPARQISDDQAEGEPAEARRQKGIIRIEREPARQPLTRIEPKKVRCMRETASAMAAATRPAIAPVSAASTIIPDSRAHDGAQAVRNFKAAVEPAHGKKFQVGREQACLDDS
jgi:hypothetical protein